MRDRRPKKRNILLPVIIVLILVLVISIIINKWLAEHGMIGLLD